MFNLHRKRMCSLLDGVWSFTFLSGNAQPESIAPASLTFDDHMAVPSAWDAHPAYVGKRGTAAYRTSFDVPPGRKAFLRFRGTGMWIRVFVDGQELSTFSLPYSQVEISLPLSEFARRELVVLNDNRFDPHRVPLQFQSYDFYAYGGIFRSVELHIVPDVYIRSVKLDAPDASTGRVHACIAFSGEAAGELPVTIIADDTVVWKGMAIITVGGVAIDFHVPEATPWSAKNPHLHTIRIEAGDDDLGVRIGFRRIDVSSGQFLVNGEPTKLLGYCRHEAHPQFGPALPLQQHAQDLQILRDLGCNFIRGSHYAQDPEFLNLCDEMGFYVFEEALGWGNVEEERFANTAFRSGQLEQTRLMIEKSRNHPCIILWGYLNEGGSDKTYAVGLYRELYDLCKSLDPSRPVTYASNVPLRDICYEYCDVISINCYPGWYGRDHEETRPLGQINKTINNILKHLSTAGQSNKPFLLSEIGAGAIYGWRDPLNAHWTEDYQNDYLEVVCHRVVSDERISGVSLWQFCDGRTYSTSRALMRPRAFNNKGTLDEYRRPKMAYKTVKRIFQQKEDSIPSGPSK